MLVELITIVFVGFGFALCAALYDVVQAMRRCHAEHPDVGGVSCQRLRHEDGGSHRAAVGEHRYSWVDRRERTPVHEWLGCVGCGVKLDGFAWNGLCVACAEQHLNPDYPHREVLDGE